MSRFEAWHIPSGNLITSFPTEAEAQAWCSQVEGAPREDWEIIDSDEFLKMPAASHWWLVATNRTEAVNTNE